MSSLPLFITVFQLVQPQHLIYSVFPFPTKPVDFFVKSWHFKQADLYKKQHLEFQRAEAAIRSIMSQPEHAQRLLDEHDPASVARSAAMGEFRGSSGTGTDRLKNIKKKTSWSGQQNKSHETSWKLMSWLLLSLIWFANIFTLNYLQFVFFPADANMTYNITVMPWVGSLTPRLPALGRIKWKGPTLPENYMPPGGISKGLVKTVGRPSGSDELLAQWIGSGCKCISCEVSPVPT